MEIGGGWERPRNSQGLSSLEGNRMSDRFDLERFVVAQDAVLENVRTELRRGSKEGHWMWFIFPQLKGLGSSSMAERFAISSRAEAEAYVAHPILGPRLIECTQLVNAVEGRSIEDIFGAVDTLKLRSSMTLFAEVARDCGVFATALDKYFAGRAEAFDRAGHPDPGSFQRWGYTPGGIFELLIRMSGPSQQFSYTPKKEKVTSKVCYTDEKGQQKCQ